MGSLSETKISAPPLDSQPRSQEKTRLVLFLSIAHLILILLGGLIAILTQNAWYLTLLIPVFSALWFWVSVKYRIKAGYIVFGILTGTSVGLIFLLVPIISLTIEQRISLAFVLSGASWLLIWLFSRRVFSVVLWWAILPGFILGGTGIGILYSSMQIFDYIFFIGISTGAGLLVWGLGQKLFGLIIAGSLVFSISPGITFSWKWITPMSVLSQIGIMLVWFALGWGVITISSRVVIEKFIWWPLIPAGVLAMVGLGLYLGGDPAIGSAVLSNSGAMGIILFGLYLTLMRWRIKR
jgi:hypothetical protein